MSNYFDNSHIDGKQLTPQQIADAIRHKKFGVDVREAMAQGLEYCMTQAHFNPRTCVRCDRNILIKQNILSTFTMSINKIFK